jgi:glycosyltransferase involved in cell wall biosynthesis
VLEALASSRSVVATGVPGMREVVAGAGAIVPAGDVERLAREVVLRLLAPDLADAEGRTGRKRVEARDDHRRQALAIAEAYDVVCRCSSGGSAPTVVAQPRRVHACSIP